jgi:two-component system alkaline phosphatase synthesis response regulator PhoP
MADSIPKILIVDDEPDIIEFITYNLQKEGFQTDHVSSGREVVAKALDYKPDLIILDIMLPDQDGVEVCRDIRHTKGLETVLVVFLTARGEDYAQIAGYESGGDAYVIKPIKPRVLISRIKAMLRRAHTPTTNPVGTQPTLSFDDLDIDPERVEVRKGAEVIILTKKEFELLYLLASKPERSFSREEIFRKIWGSNIIVGNRTLDVHIQRLRSKIGEEYIQTVKEVGYKFTP